MTEHYHGTPISPIRKLYELSGRLFCVSFAHPQDVARVHAIGQKVMLDNGAFSAWRSGATVNWPGYYEWCDRWLDYPSTWAVIPDIVDAGENEQDDLLNQWPHGDRGAPVWHMHEGISRLLYLIDTWPKVCIGSSADYATILSASWCRRMDETWNAISRTHRRTPKIHMLRGMATLGRSWPFYSVDSTDVARNHNRKHNSPRAMADRWDCLQCLGTFKPTLEQEELL